MKVKNKQKNQLKADLKYCCTKNFRAKTCTDYIGLTNFLAP